MSKTILKVENVHSWLLTSDEKIKTLLHDLLRFRPPDFWANEAYKMKKWDGYQDFFNDKSGKFLTGLLPEVQRALRAKNHEYLISDSRDKFKWERNNVGPEFLNEWLPKDKDPVTLHDFQPDLANQCFTHNRGIVTAPTGAGKTFILISVLKSLPPKTPVLFLTKNAGLVHQNYLEMQEWGVENLGRWYSKYKELNYTTCATVHVKTFESLANMLPKFKVLLIDEAHECMSKVPKLAYQKMKSAVVRLGFSATPFKYDDKEIEKVHKWYVKGHIGPIFKTSTTKSGILTTADLQERGILSASDCHFYPIDKPELKHEPYQDAVKLGIEQNFDFHEIVSRLAKSRPGRTLVVVERIEQGQYLNQMIPGSVFIQGKNSLKDREPVINALKAGDKFVAIVMRQIITAGINVKIHDLINAAGGNSAHNMIQLLGRGLRTAEDKDMLHYHDFRFNINDYLQDHSDWRMSVLEKEGHKVTLHEKVDF